MTDDTKRTPRRITARRAIALGTVAGTALGAAAYADTTQSDTTQAEDGWVQLAQSNSSDSGSSSGSGSSGGGSSSGSGSSGGGEGEGEGSSGGEGEGSSGGEGGGEGEGEGEGGAMANPDIGFIRDLDFMEGHIRAGLALYEADDLEAAKTHMGHPIEEKYGAVADRLEQMGYSDLRQEITTLSDMTENEADNSEVQSQYETVRETLEQVRGEFSPAQQLRALAALTRVAAEEYTIATEGGEISNLHEYQDSWGFMQLVQAEAQQFTEEGNEQVAQAAEEFLTQFENAQAAFGDLQGEGDYEMDASILYGAAARMDIAADQIQG